MSHDVQGVKRQRGARGTHPRRSHGSRQAVDVLGLARARWAKHHEAVSDTLRLKELDELERPRRVVDETCLLDLRVDGRFKLGIAHLWGRVGE